MGNLLDDSFFAPQHTVSTDSNAGSAAADKRLSDVDAIAAGRIGLWRLDLVDESLSACAICRDIYGCSDGDAFGLERFVGAVHPEDRDGRAQAINAAIASDGPFDVEFRIDAAAAGERWVEMRGGLLRGEDGKPHALAGALIDVTPRRLDEEQRALVAEELSHRMKNNVMLMQAIVGQTMRSVRTLAEARTMLEARIVALGSSSVRLLETEGEDTLIVDVLRQALTPFGFDTSPALHWAGPEVSLPPPMAIAFGLALHELATNAVKHGALSVPTGEVRIVWSITDGDHGRHLHLSWDERGGPAIAQPIGSGFGSKLIRRCLENRVGGQLQFEFREVGLRMELHCPLIEVR